MAQSTLRFTVDTRTAKKFDAICSSLGITTPEAVRAFLIMVALFKRLPFPITSDELLLARKGVY